MAHTASSVARIPRLSRFGWLMALYAENCARLNRLFAPGRLATGRYVSSTGDGLDVYLDVIETHRYTVELRLTYGLHDPVTGEPDPSAFIRLYRDAGQAEATHCYVGRRWQDVIGLYPPPDEVIGHRMRMNTFLGKWLEYLAEQGHGVATLHPLQEQAATAEAY
ncbi:hypothetical protein CSC70_08680 [Pseudoxanthomonas kalamensis DSM 18571]|uniref:DUF1249 domain-containing protein n=1 Tax=Pseudoxanthomonas kalamensis TaxID=289483 RepID=UPI0013917F77|nr:DUF1249 domain-containing protein [Pseudoxanthomonas kalamensis]KAF1709763.1 hypothetical protein CSC70_08680 [Pseudoxanthomonas kalamensis DSM 18571]